jgi:hypothetical protein
MDKVTVSMVGWCFGRDDPTCTTPWNSTWASGSDLAKRRPGEQRGGNADAQPDDIAFASQCWKIIIIITTITVDLATPDDEFPCPREDQLGSCHAYRTPSNIHARGMPIEKHAGEYRSVIHRKTRQDRLNTGSDRGGNGGEYTLFSLKTLVVAGALRFGAAWAR